MTEVLGSRSAVIFRYPVLLIGPAQTLPSSQMVRAWTFLYHKGSDRLLYTQLIYLRNTSFSKRDNRFKISTFVIPVGKFSSEAS